MTLQQVLRRVKRILRLDPPKRTHTVHASRSKLALNWKEVRFAETYALEPSLKAASRAAGISMRTGQLWLRKPKITDWIKTTVKAAGLANHMTAASNEVSRR